MAKTPAKKTPRTKRYIDWGKVRDEWAADQGLNFKMIADRFGMTKQAIQRRAGREGWKRVDPNESEVQQAMRTRADAKSVANPASVEVLPPEETPAPPGKPTPRAKQAAIEARATIIDRHRRELNIPRNRIYKASQETDIAKATSEAKLAKLMAEGLAIVQANERKAWSLDGDQTRTIRIIQSRRDHCD